MSSSTETFMYLIICSRKRMNREQGRHEHHCILFTICIEKTFVNIIFYILYSTNLIGFRTKFIHFFRDMEFSF